MFTGLVQALGRVEVLEEGRLVVDLGDWPITDDPIAEGESIAVNGCCLTVLPLRDGFPIAFDLSPETLRRTAFEFLAPGAHVNLERAMKANDRFGGHIVQGHVDAVGELVENEDLGDHHRIRFRAPAEYDRYLIDKGSVTIDGISLTVVNPKDGVFDTWIIPHTLSHTNLGALLPGSKVNMEFDVLAKHVEKLFVCRNEGRV